MTTRSRAAADRLTSLIRRFRGRSVAVLGDLVADEFVYGDIARVSREAPVLILEQRRVETAPGGGGNAVANLCALGARVRAIGVVGRDESGARLVEQLALRGCRTDGILTLGGYDTPTKSRILAGGVHTRRQQIVRLDRGVIPSGRALRSSEGLLVADYSYGAAAPALVRPLLSGLRRRRLPVTVDSRARVVAFRGMTACTPNQEEVELALGLGPLDGTRTLDAAGRELRKRTAAVCVVVTRGAQGMSLYQRGRPPVHVPAYGSDEVADVTGAGDTVIATFTLGLIVGATPADSARLANYAAGLVVRKAGTATVSDEELIEAVREDAG